EPVRSGHGPVRQEDHLRPRRRLGEGERELRRNHRQPAEEVTPGPRAGRRPFALRPLSSRRERLKTPSPAFASFRRSATSPPHGGARCCLCTFGELCEPAIAPTSPPPCGVQRPP